MKFTSQKYAGKEFTFDGITVILGINGVGKSRFLRAIREFITKHHVNGDIVYVEGGRTISISDAIMTGIHQYGDHLEGALMQYRQHKTQPLSGRLHNALLVLDKMDAHMKSLHSDAVNAWIEEGSTGPCPKRKQPPLDRIFDLFTEIFPRIELSYQVHGKKFVAKKDNETYGPSQFSDGEKQVFSILIDLIGLNENYQFLVVDEPELNLHPELAERLWTLVEGEFPDKTFIYASHSISFAMRSNVNRVYVLSGDSGNISEFSDLGDLPRTEVIKFLGAVPGILSTSNVLVTEGTEKSFDSIFYRWLLEDKTIEILPAGGCGDVLSIINKSGVWNRVSTITSLTGVIDSDFRSGNYLDSILKGPLHVLKLHEAESYLCIPSVACAVAERIGSQEHLITEEDINAQILNALQSDRLTVAAHRVLASASITLAVSIERKIMRDVSNHSAMIEVIKQASHSELGKAATRIDPTQLENAFNQELNHIDKIVSARDIFSALSLLPGKQMLQSIAPKVGCRNGSDFMRSLSKNFKPTEFAPLFELKNNLKDAMQRNTLD